MSWLSNLFGGGVVSSIEKIATEWIDTPEEKAKASALMVKTLDPNGLMRRQISNRISILYMIYIFVMLILLLAQSFDLGNAVQITEAVNSMKELFVPTTTMFTMIVGASFGVNGLNSIKGK